DGTSGQSFRVLHAPTLALADDETLQVEVRSIDRGDGAAAGGGLAPDEGWRDWERRDSLRDSGHEDRHFLFDPLKGEVSFGIAIQGRADADGPDAAGGWHQHGAVPPAG